MPWCSASVKYKLHRIYGRWQGCNREIERPSAIQVCGKSSEGARCQKWGFDARIVKSRVDYDVIACGGVQLNNRCRPSKSMDRLLFIDSSTARRTRDTKKLAAADHVLVIRQRNPGDALPKSYRPDLIMTDAPNDWVGSIQAKDGQGPSGEPGGPNHHPFPCF